MHCSKKEEKRRKKKKDQRKGTPFSLLALQVDGTKPKGTRIELESVGFEEGGKCNKVHVKLRVVEYLLMCAIVDESVM